MLAQAQRLATAAAAWLFKGVPIDPTVILIGAAVAAVLWLATMRRGEVPPPRGRADER